jgi:peptide/nickel transport system substrate-binding protein
MRERAEDVIHKGGLMKRAGRRGQSFWLATVVAVGLVTVTSASGAAGGGSAAGAARAASGTLVIAESSTPATLDPDFSTGNSSLAVLENAYGNLTDFGVSGSGDALVSNLKKGPIPYLAQSWSFSADGRTLTMRLRKGVKSPAGSEMTTADVDWSWKRSLAVGGAGGFLFGIASINQKKPLTVVDRYTFKIHLLGPNPLFPLLEAIPIPFSPIFDSAEVKKHVTASDPWARKWVASNTAGYGPYMVTRYAPGSEVVWEVNPNFFGAGRLRVQKYIEREVPEEATRLSLVKAGAVDIATELGPISRRDAANTSGVKVIGVRGNNGFIIGVNLKAPPFDKREVRQAVAHAIPSETIIKNVLLGSKFAVDDRGYVPVAYPFAHKGGFAHWPYSYNIAKAKALMKKAGVTNASATIYIHAGNPQDQQAAIIVRDALAKIGIDLQVQPLTASQYQDRYFKASFEMLLIEDAPWVADPAYVLANYFYPRPTGVANWANYANPAAVKLMRKALDARNPAQRLRFAGQANRIVVNDAPWSAYINTGTFLTVRSNVSGYLWRLNSLLDYRYFSKAS